MPRLLPHRPAGRQPRTSPPPTGAGPASRPRRSPPASARCTRCPCGCGAPSSAPSTCSTSSPATMPTGRRRRRAGARRRRHHRHPPTPRRARGPGPATSSSTTRSTAASSSSRPRAWWPSEKGSTWSRRSPGCARTPATTTCAWPISPAGSSRDGSAPHRSILPLRPADRLAIGSRAHAAGTRRTEE